MGNRQRHRSGPVPRGWYRVPFWERQNLREGWDGLFGNFPGSTRSVLSGFAYIHTRMGWMGGRRKKSLQRAHYCACDDVRNYLGQSQDQSPIRTNRQSSG